jgi:DNA-binding transcriptional ArsR family regulator
MAHVGVLGEDRLAHIYVCPYDRAVQGTLHVLDVIAEPTRRRILDAVRGGERSVGELVEEVGMHQPGVSRHLKVLRDAGLVEVRRDAQRRLYRLRPEPLMELDAWLEPYRLEWANRLDSLERHLQATTRPIRPGTKKETA